MKIFAYRAFGFNVESDLELPDLAAGHANGYPTLEISLGDLVQPSGGQGWDMVDQSLFLWWADVGSFTVRSRRIVVSPVPTCPLRVVRLPLLGPVLAAALQLSGLLTLHGNAVRVGKSVAIFVGEKGRGKSTITAALLASGHQLVSDDVVALRTVEAGHMDAFPGFPGMKLWQDSLNYCQNIAVQESWPILEGYDKLYLRLADRHFASQPAALGAIYVLEEGETVALHQMEPRQAFRQLVTHTYGSRYGSAVLAGPIAASHFRDCSKLIKQAAVKTLCRTRELSSLAEMVRLVEMDLGAKS